MISYTGSADVVSNVCGAEVRERAPRLLDPHMSQPHGDDLMKLPTEAEAQLRELADALAESKVNAAMSAAQMMIAEIFRILISKGLLTREEFADRLSLFETLAASTRTKTPDTSDALTRITMDLRNAFFQEKKTPN